MTVIRPNSISGINSITGNGGDISIFRADGTAADVTVNNITSGVITATTFKGAVEGNLSGGTINATSGTITGNLGVGGVLTYEDVTNIDSIGIITARAGINVSGGVITGDGSGLTGVGLGTDGSVNTSGIITATAFVPTTGQLSHRNIIINGAMQVAQRGTSSTTSGMKTVDRWTSNYSGGGVTQSQVSEQTGTVFENGFSNYLRLTNTSNTTTDTDYRFIGTTIEAQNVANSGWNFKSASSYVTLTAWVRSSLAGTYYGWLNSRDGTGQNYTFSYTLSANTWTKITKTIPGNNNISIHNNNEEGLVVHFIPWYGTYYTTSGYTLNAWQAQSSTNRCPDYSQNWANTSNATFDVTGVQLEVGPVATPFEHRSIGDELSRCQRYCQKASVYVASGSAGNNNIYGFTVNFMTEMRAAPTLHSSSSIDGTGNFSSRRNGSETSGNPTIRNSNTNSVTLGHNSGQQADWLYGQVLMQSEI